MPSMTVSFNGETSVGLDTFSVAPLTPETSFTETIGLVVVGDMGAALWRPHANDSATNTDTPITKYVFRIHELLAKRESGRQKVRVNNTRTSQRRATIFSNSRADFFRASSLPTSKKRK